MRRARGAWELGEQERGGGEGERVLHGARGIIGQRCVDVGRLLTTTAREEPLMHRFLLLFSSVDLYHACAAYSWTNGEEEVVPQAQVDKVTQPGKAKKEEIFMVRVRVYLTSGTVLYEVLYISLVLAHACPAMDAQSCRALPLPHADDRPLILTSVLDIHG